MASPRSGDRPGGPARRRNDPAQYDDLAGEWWRPRGAFAMLHWLAAARARLVPPAPHEGAVLVDLGCGGGLLAPHLAGRGYRHIGLDLTSSALRQARDHGVVTARADVTRLPLADACADVVCAGEILEHVDDLDAVVAEACRVLRPGGTLVVDTIARSRLARVVAIELAERIPHAAPPGLHDPALLVDRSALERACAASGVSLTLRGIRPGWRQLASWALRRSETVEMVPAFTSAVLFQAWGTKR